MDKTETEPLERKVPTSISIEFQDLLWIRENDIPLSTICQRVIKAIREDEDITVKKICEESFDGSEKKD